MNEKKVTVFCADHDGSVRPFVLYESDARRWLSCGWFASESEAIAHCRKELVANAEAAQARLREFDAATGEGAAE